MTLRTDLNRLLKQARALPRRVAVVDLAGATLLDTYRSVLLAVCRGLASGQEQEVEAVVVELADQMRGACQLPHCHPFLLWVLGLMFGRWKIPAVLPLDHLRGFIERHQRSPHFRIDNACQDCGISRSPRCTDDSTCWACGSSHLSYASIRREIEAHQLADLPD
jgi:hypothetical protein